MPLRKRLGFTVPIPPNKKEPSICLLVFDEPPALHELGNLVGRVAGKQEPVARLHLVGKSHERQGVTAEGCKIPKRKGSDDFNLRDLVWKGPPRSTAQLL